MGTLSNKLKEVNRAAVGNPVGYKAITIIYGAVAQLGERLSCTQKVEGSRPSSSTQWNKSLKKSVLVGTKGYKRTIKFLLLSKK